MCGRKGNALPWVFMNSLSLDVCKPRLEGHFGMVAFDALLGCLHPHTLSLWPKFLLNQHLQDGTSKNSTAGNGAQSVTKYFKPLLLNFTKGLGTMEKWSIQVISLPAETNIDTLLSFHNAPHLNPWPFFSFKPPKEPSSPAMCAQPSRDLSTLRSAMIWAPPSGVTRCFAHNGCKVGVRVRESGVLLSPEQVSMLLD